MRRAIIASLAFATLIGTPAAAQMRDDPYAQRAIMSRDFVQAERQLRAEARIHPDRPEVLLNLAAVMAQTGRTDEARTLYDRVLADEDVSMRLTGERVAPSHGVARAGLARLGSTAFDTQMATR